MPKNTVGKYTNCIPAKYTIDCTDQLYIWEYSQLNYLLFPQNTVDKQVVYYLYVN